MDVVDATQIIQSSFYRIVFNLNHKLVISGKQSLNIYGSNDVLSPIVYAYKIMLLWNIGYWYADDEEDVVGSNASDEDY